ncbi:MAG TPA: hypothetical protein VL371_14545, partial [Gemmataceae bacterium]|nr:hypothetical protein [Gemmataceae bacterium]
GNTLRASRKAQLRTELAAANASAEETRKALDEFDRRPVRYQDVERFVNTLEGQYAAILYSLQKDAPAAGEAEFNALDLAPDEWLSVTAKLLSMQVVERPAEGQGPGGPLPATGGGESQPTNPPPPSETSTPKLDASGST